jgi:hypothetical protein
MVRLLILLLSSLARRRLAPAEPAWAASGATGGWSRLDGGHEGGPGGGASPAGGLPPAWPDPDPGPARAARAPGPPSGWPPGPPQRSRPRRRWVPRWVKWSAVVILVGLIFRRVIASVVLMALSAMLHFLGFNVHLPHVRFAWPWQTITAGSTTTAQIGPWVLQKIEGISKPALGTENFSFVFTRKVSRNIGPWPCWYSSTFYAVGHASATVNLNPGPSWWTAGPGHYRLQVLSEPQPGKPGRVAVAMVLPPPQLPQSAHDVSIDNTLSRPLDSQHSWTYPGLGCGALIRPQFAQSVLYAEAQSLAFYRVNHVSQVTGPLIGAAETEASQMIRNNFIQPTVNAFGYTLDSFTLRWSATP